MGTIAGNTRKEIEDKTFVLKENIRSLKVELGDVKLEYNYLSSPDQLNKSQSQYFENDFIKIDITKIKKISKENNQIKLTDFLKKINDE